MPWTWKNDDLEIVSEAIEEMDNGRWPKTFNLTSRDELSIEQTYQNGKQHQRNKPIDQMSMRNWTNIKQARPTRCVLEATMEDKPFSDWIMILKNAVKNESSHDQKLDDCIGQYGKYKESIEISVEAHWRTKWQEHEKKQTKLSNELNDRLNDAFKHAVPGSPIKKTRSIVLARSGAYKEKYWNIWLNSQNGQEQERNEPREKKGWIISWKQNIDQACKWEKQYKYWMIYWSNCFDHTTPTLEAKWRRQQW
jgi:hypothetical protein